MEFGFDGESGINFPEFFKEKAKVYNFFGALYESIKSIALFNL